MNLLKCGIGLLALTCILSAPVYSDTPLTVTRCIDGDTLQLSNGEKIRLIGVDTRNRSLTRSSIGMLREPGRMPRPLLSRARRRLSSPANS